MGKRTEIRRNKQYNKGTREQRGTGRGRGKWTRVGEGVKGEGWGKNTVQRKETASCNNTTVERENRGARRSRKEEKGQENRGEQEKQARGKGQENRGDQEKQARGI